MSDAQERYPYTLTRWQQLIIAWLDGNHDLTTNIADVRTLVGDLLAQRAEAARLYIDVCHKHDEAIAERDEARAELKAEKEMSRELRRERNAARAHGVELRDECGAAIIDAEFAFYAGWKHGSIYDCTRNSRDANECWKRYRADPAAADAALVADIDHDLVAARDNAPTQPYALTRREAFAIELYARALRDDMGEQLTDIANASVRGADALIEQLDAIDPNEDDDDE